MRCARVLATAVLGLLTVALGVAVAPPVSSDPGSSPHPSAAPTTRPGTVTSSPARPASVSTSVPVVAFPALVRVVAGRLRTPVLLADPTVTALARVVGEDASGCRVPLRAGVPAWLDCPVAGSGAVRVEVVLSDGRSVVRDAQRASLRNT